MNFSSNFMREVSEIAGILDCELIEKMSKELSNLRKRDGRLFLLGVGGSAANASHAVNDFSEDLTVIIISHRLGTLKNCDVIYKLSDGKLKPINLKKYLQNKD